MKKIFALIFMTMLLAASMGHADGNYQNQQLTQWVESEITRATHSMSYGDSQEDRALMSVGNESSWFLKNFLLRIRAQFGIDVIGLVQFQVVPELEMIFNRDFPAGYEGWKPQP